MTYPQIRPKVIFDFQNSRQLDHRITFSRTSGANYHNPDTGLVTLTPVNVARFEKKGLLIEEAGTNVLNWHYPSTVSNAPNYSHSSNHRTTITGLAATAPDGTQTACRVTENLGTDDQGHKFRTTNIQGTAGKRYSFSCYVKAGERTHVVITRGMSRLAGADGSGYFSVQANLEIGEIVGTNNVNSEDIIFEYISNGWYRFGVTCNCITTGAINVNYQMTDGGSDFKHIGDGTSGMFFWGNQAEESDFVTSLMRSEGSQASRAADTAHITLNNFSSWYNQTEGTMLVSVTNGIRAKDGANLYGSGNVRRVMLNQSNFRLRYQTVGSVTTFQNVNIDSANNVRTANPLKYAYAYKPKDYALSANGSTSTDTIRKPTTTVNRMLLGEESAFGGSGRLNGAISRIAYYDRRLSNAEMEAITS